MNRLPLLLGIFFSFATGGIAFLLCLTAKVTVNTLIFRTLVIFFAFAFIGVAFGSYLEVVLMPGSVRKESEKVAEELKLEDESIEEELGDLLIGSSNGDVKEPGTPGFKPAVFPQMTVEGGNVVSRGNSAIVS